MIMKSLRSARSAIEMSPMVIGNELKEKRNEKLKEAQSAKEPQQESVKRKRPKQKEAHKNKPKSKYEKNQLVLSRSWWLH